MPRIQLPYGVVEDNKAKIKLNPPKNYKAGEYFKKLPYLNDINDLAFQDSVVDVVNNRDNFHHFLLATSDIGRTIQENLNAVVTDGRLTDAVVRHTRDTVHKNSLAKPNSLQVPFKNVKKFAKCGNTSVGKFINANRKKQIIRRRNKKIARKNKT